MPPVPRALALTALLSAAALLATPISGAAAAPISTDGLAAQRPAAAKRARAAQAATTDPRAAEQWSLQGDGPMGVASAWRQTTGGDVTVAVIDSGVDLAHPDLAPNLWTNPGEIPNNGIDDDGNGYVDDVHGYDFVNGNGNPQDGNGHGTHVAGIIAARGGNGIGGTGVAWRARLMAIRVLDDAARGTTTDVARGIRYAVDNGARIVNLSLAGPSATKDLEDAIAYADQHGVLVVVAAGNEGKDLAVAPTYPAGFTDGNVIGVAATAQTGALSQVSDYGPGADLAAPGEDILSTALGGGYEWRTGTSMAAPNVAGTLVLLAAARPDLGARALRDALLAGARRDGLPVETGALDAGASLHTVIAADAWRAAAPPAETVRPTTLRATTALTRAKARARTTARANERRKARTAKARRRAVGARSRGRVALRRHR